MKTLNIIGAGRLGKTLAYLFYQHQVFLPHCILNREFCNAEKAAHFIGAGTAVAAIDDVTPADVTLIAVPDDDIALVTAELVKARLFSKNHLVFHCSGALSSLVLKSLVGDDVFVASAHPIISFATARKRDLHCYCTLEGDKNACQVLNEAFNQIGATTLTIQQQQKIAYHSAMVMASNGLLGLLKVVTEQLRILDIDEPTALAMIQPLVQQCVSDAFANGTALALTGPVSRGDWQLVEQEVNYLEKNNKIHASLYRLLGLSCLQLALECDKNKDIDVVRMQQVLEQ